MKTCHYVNQSGFFYSYPPCGTCRPIDNCIPQLVARNCSCLFTHVNNEHVHLQSVVIRSQIHGLTGFVQSLRSRFLNQDSIRKLGKFKIYRPDQILLSYFYSRTQELFHGRGEGIIRVCRSRGNRLVYQDPGLFLNSKRKTFWNKTAVKGKRLL